MTRSHLRVVDVNDLPDGRHEVLWSNGSTTTVDADGLARIERREARLDRFPEDAA